MKDGTEIFWAWEVTYWGHKKGFLKKHGLYGVFFVFSLFFLLLYLDLGYVMQCNNDECFSHLCLHTFASTCLKSTHDFCFVW